MPLSSVPQLAALYVETDKESVWGFRVQGWKKGFRAKGLGFGVWGLQGFRVSGT